MALTDRPGQFLLALVRRHRQAAEPAAPTLTDILGKAEAEIGLASDAGLDHAARVERILAASLIVPPAIYGAMMSGDSEITLLVAAARERIGFVRDPIDVEPVDLLDPAAYRAALAVREAHV